jgi:hypothetical protein
VRGTGWADAVSLGPTVNAGGALHAWIAPDESFMLFNSGRSGSHTQLDIWISFRDAAGTWSVPQNLGEPINSGADAILCPTLSPDGDYLFFTRLDMASGTGRIYWAKADFLRDLRPRQNGED